MDSYELEDAARELCRIRGLNPHEMVLAPAQGNGSATLAVHSTRPRWMNVRDEMIANKQIAFLLPKIKHAGDKT